MAGKSTQAESIATIQTDVAVLRERQDNQNKEMNQAMARLEGKVDRLATTIDNLKYVPFDSFTEHVRGEKELYIKFDERLTSVEDYQTKNDRGTRFSNQILDKWQTLLVTLIIVAALAALAYNVWPRGV